MKNESHGYHFDSSFKREDDRKNKAQLFNQLIPALFGLSVGVVKEGQQDGVDEDHGDDEIVEYGPAGQPNNALSKAAVALEKE